MNKPRSINRKLERERYYSLIIDIGEDMNDISRLYRERRPRYGIPWCRKFLEFYILYKKFLLLLWTRGITFSQSLLHMDYLQFYDLTVKNGKPHDTHLFIGQNLENDQWIWVTCVQPFDTNGENRRSYYKKQIEISQRNRCGKTIILALGNYFFTNSQERANEKYKLLNRLQSRTSSGTAKKPSDPKLLVKALQAHVDVLCRNADHDIEILYIWDIEHLYNTREYQLSITAPPNRVEGVPYRLPRLPRIRRTGTLARFLGGKSGEQLHFLKISETAGRSDMFRKIN